MENPGKDFSYQEGGELLTIDFGEDGEKIGEAGVGDPHFFAIEDVVFAVWSKLGASATVKGVRSGGSLREGVGADNFSGGQARKVFFLLLSVPK